MAATLPAVASLLVYWETQQSAFCGVHACNNLLQNPLFDEASFRAFARHLDREEAALLGGDEAGSKAARAVAGRGTSDNFDPRTGLFSVSVLLHALKRAGLRPVPFGSEAAQFAGVTRDPAGTAECSAFLVNTGGHYYALRRFALASVAGVTPLNSRCCWADLNSTIGSPRAFPVVAGGSGSPLEARIMELIADGCTVYAVLGDLPPPAHLQRPDAQLASRGQWYRLNLEGGASLPVAGVDARFVKGAADRCLAQDAYTKAIAVLTEATTLDANGTDLARAVGLYTSGIEQLMKVLQNVPDQKRRESIRKRISGYLSRAEQLKEMLHAK